MEEDSEFQMASYNAPLICDGCRRYFSQLNAFNNHLGSCKPQKKRMASALEMAKEAYGKKKARLNGTASPSRPHLPTSEPSQEVTIPDSNTDIPDPEEGNLLLHLSDGRPRRENRRLPLCYRNEQPAALPSLPPPTEPLQAAVIPTTSLSVSPTANPARRILKSRSDAFGLSRQYHAISFPAHDPDAELELSDLSEVPSDHSDDATNIPTTLFQPYPNQNAFLLGEWYWNGGAQKTKEDFKKLIGIVCDQAFNPADVRDVLWDSLNERLGGSIDSEDIWFDEPDAGWTETSITLLIPFRKLEDKQKDLQQKRKGALQEKCEDKKGGLQHYTFPPFRHRSIVSVLKEKMSNPYDFRNFHLEPYELRWHRRDMPDAESSRVYGELYTSPAFLEAHEEIQSLAGEPGCSLPRVLIGLMFGSDATHLTSFGSASLWPCYMYFGNESKYRRCKPTCNLCNHIAYFHKLPPEFKDFATLHTGGRGANAKFMAHCERELLHAQWKVLLGDDFLEAYKHGVIIECCDGLKRRFYFRIFAYSADYPEKVKLSSIRNMGDCPCPRCLIPITKLYLVGTVNDKKQRSRLARVDDESYQSKISKARGWLYECNDIVNSKRIEDLLKPESLVPAQNAFSEILSPLGFNLFSVFLVDFMHEIELGVWKNLFIHLLRILESVNGTNVMDERFRQVPTFGRDSIRRFTNSVSELKKLGARDYENLLQCSIPVFEGLLPKKSHNKHLLELLFILAHWHALAKLRQHTDLSLTILESVTIELGKSLREFQKKVCPFYNTKELIREASARERQTAKKKKAAASGPTPEGASMAVVSNPTPATLSSSNVPIEAKASGRRDKTLNLNSYKGHSLGDYVETIRRNGTVDSYSTEQMELEHRSPKSRYLRTSRKQFEKQLSQIERRQARIRRIRQKFNEAGKTRVSFDREKGPESSACDYHIGKTQNHPVDLGTLTRESQSDPAAKDFVKKLKEHLLPRIISRLQGPLRDESSTQTAQNSVLIKDNRIYNHKLARFYHTTYDVRRSEDIINPRTSHCNIMLLSDLGLDKEATASEASVHPFLYGRVIGIYHANAVYIGPGTTGYEATRLDFLHVRWFQLDSGSGWNFKSLDCLSFPPMSSEDAFGFVDPSLVLRSCHLIPNFSLKKRHLDGISLSGMSRDGQDWASYYVNRFADRDMVMRYHWGLGIGHTYSHGPDIRSQQYEAAAEEAEAEVEIPLGYASPGNAFTENQPEDDSEGSHEDFSGSEASEDDQDDMEGDDEDFIELIDTYD